MLHRTYSTLHVHRKDNSTVSKYVSVLKIRVAVGILTSLVNRTEEVIGYLKKR